MGALKNPKDMTTEELKAELAQLEGAAKPKDPKDMTTEELKAELAAIESQPRPKSTGDEIIEAVGREAKNLFTGPSIGERIPIIGPLAKRAADATVAGIESLVSGKSFSRRFDEMKDQDRARMNVAQEKAPVTSALKEFMAGAMLPVPGAGAKGLVGVGKRVIGGAAISGADIAARGGDAEQIKDAATLTGGLQAGIEAAVPAVKAIAKPIGAMAKKGMNVIFGAPKEAVEAYLANPEAIRAAQKLETLKDTLDDQIALRQGVLHTAENQARVANDVFKEARIVLDKGLDAQRLQLTETVRDAADNLRLSSSQLKADVKSLAVPDKVADDIVAKLANEKQVLGSLSEQADDALARANISVPKNHLIDFVQKIGAGIGVEQKGGRRVLISSEDKAAVAKLVDLRDRLDSLDDVVDGPALREIMRSVRKDIDWNPNVAEFNSTLNGALKDFQQRVSGFLKTQAPEYAGYMERMADLSESLKELAPHFGTRDKAIASLHTMVSSDAAKARIIGEKLANYLRHTGNEVPQGFVDDIVNATGKKMITSAGDLVATGENATALGKIAMVKEAKAIMKSPKDWDTLVKTTGEHGELVAAKGKLQAFDAGRDTARASALAASAERQVAEQAERQLAQAIKDMQVFGGMTQKGTQTFLKRAMNGKDIEARKRLDAISKVTGIDFVEAVKNRSFADAFEKGYMHGSRNVNLWAIIGAVFGGKALKGGEALGVNVSQLPAMAGVGAGIGATVDKMGPKMAQKALDAFIALRDSKYAPKLLEAAKNGRAALAVTHAALMDDPVYQRIFENAMQSRLKQGE